MRLELICDMCKTNWGDWEKIIHAGAWVYCPKCGQKELLTKGETG